jgi:short-subunit dehydrogenase
MDSGLEGKGALVAGASAGIGLAIARGLAREGASVAIVARRQAELDEAARSIRTETGAEVADLAVYLASDRATYLTATVVAADGGRCRGLL